jgi:hypothetical protein
MTFRLRTWLLVIALLAPAGAAVALEPDPAPPVSYYGRVMSVTRQVESQGDILMWGRLVERLPARVLGLRVDYRSRRYDSAYSNENRVIDVIQPLQPRDPFGGSGDFFKLETEVSGRLQFIDLRLSYGILDNLTYFVDMPLVQQEADLDFRFRPGTSRRVGVNTLTEAFAIFERQGRPLPDQRYDSVGWDPGDLTTGFLWTYLESDYVSLTGQVSVIVPTGFLADPNQSQRFGTGAQLDISEGSVAPGVTNMAHVRLPRGWDWIGLWLEGSVFFYLEDDREAPDWDRPMALPDGLSDRLHLDDARFADLSDTDRFYSVAPGAKVESLGAVTFYLHYFTLGLGYFYDYHQEPRLEASSELLDFFEATDAYRAGDSHRLGLHLGLPLSWLKLPGILNVGYAYPLSGRNTLRLEDSVDLQTVFFFPLF